jgi:hypothetical protein
VGNYERNAEDRYRALLDEIQAEFPGFRLIHKHDSLLQRSIGSVLKVVTYGGQRSYQTRYTTTLGERVYVPVGWDEWAADERWLVLRHERVHLRQFRRWTFPLMALLYLALPLPLGLAWARMRFEREAYEETIRAGAELYGRAHVCNAAFRERIVEQFVSGAYGWMWPFRGSMERWYDGVLATIAG